MSTTIDSRVVDMQFNNKQFESGISTSIQSLDNLKKGLGNLEGSGNSLKALQAAASSFSLANMAAGIEDLKKRFSTLGIVGIAAITNIANEAVNMGKNLVSAFTIDPIKTGFQEYETKMNAIQTILTNTASKGTTLDDVNAALEELNVYADQTIYNFAEMTRNIGTFTAAGVDLKTATMSIKGIANLAAGSGSNAQQASTAMYQLSQALAAGKVSLMDWNSVVNAGMGGELFQKALEKTAVELGHGRDMSKSFRESLQDGWMTAEVLTKTLQKFADDPALVKAATQVKTFTQMIDTMKESVQSGWAQSWETIIGNKEEAAALFTGINDAFGRIVGASSEARNQILKDWKTLGGRDAIIQGLVNAFNGLAAVLKPIQEAFREVFPPITGEILANMSKNFRDLTANFKIGEATAWKIKTTFKGLFSVLSVLAQILSTVARGVGTLLGVFVPSASGGILGVTAALGGYLTKVSETIKASGIFAGVLENLKKTIQPIPGMFGWLQNIPPMLLNFANTVKTTFGKVSSVISTNLQKIDFNQVFAFINSGLLVGVLLGIKKLIGAFTGVVEDAGGFKSKIAEIFGGVTDSLSALQDQLKSGTLMKIAIAIGILAVALVVLSTIDPKKLASALGAITVLFGELFGSLTLFEKAIGGVGLKSLGTLTLGLMGIATAVLTLAIAMKILSTVRWQDIIKGLIGLGGMALILVKSAKALSAGSGAMIKNSAGFIIFAGALFIMAEALTKIAKLSANEIAKGLGGLMGIMIEVVAFMAITDKNGLVTKSAASLLILGVAINTLVGAVSRLGNMDPIALTQGLAALGMMLLEIMTFTVIVGDTKMLISTAVSLGILSTALVVMTSAISGMGSLPIETIAVGLSTMAFALIIMGVAMKKMEGSLKGSAALFIMAASLAVLTPVIMMLGSMPIENIVKALFALSGVFVILGVAGTTLGGLVPALIGIGAAIVLIGLGTMAAGAGLLLVAAGLTALGVAAIAFSAALIVVATNLITTINIIIDGLGAAVRNIGDEIIATTPIVITAITTMITGMVNAMVSMTPYLTQSGCNIILSILYGISANIPFIVTAAVDCIVAFLNAISANLYRVIAAGVELIISFINGLANALRDHTPELVAAINNLMDAVVTAGKEALFGSIAAFTNIGKNAIQGFIDGLKSGWGMVTSAASSVAKGALTAAKDALDIHSPSRAFAELGMYSNMGFAEGLKSFGGIVATAAAGVGTTAISALSSSIGSISDLINSDVNINPTIRPVVDLTNVEAGLQSTFGQERNLNVAGVATTVSATATNQNRSMGVTDTVNPINTPVASTNVNVVVNNPKKEVAEDSIRKTMLRYSYGM